MSKAETAGTSTIGTCSTDEVTFDNWTTAYPIAPPATGCERWPNFLQSHPQRPHLHSRRVAETENSKYWRIHGKLYDLDDFVEHHPGGKIWLELTRGTDATQAVEAYHLDYQKVDKILQKHFVRDVNPGEFNHGDRFTFAEDGFFRTLRSRLLERLLKEAGPGATTREATGPTASMKAACAAVIAQFAGAHILARRTGSVAAAALAGFFQIGMWGVGHNFMHQAEDKSGVWKYAMDMNAAHSADWRISHALSHHLDTNLDTDFEHNFFLMDYKNKMRQGLIAPVAMALSPLVSMLQSMEYLISTLKEALSSSTGDRHGWSNLVPGLLPLLQLMSYYHGQGSWKRSLALFSAQFVSHQFCFLPLALGVHHAAAAPESDTEQLLRDGPSPRGTLAWVEGQEGKAKDFGVHQASSTSTHTVYPRSMPAFLRDYLSLTAYGYLNNHVMHHLFPGVDASRLQGAYDLFETTAKEFGIPAKNTQTWSKREIAVGWWRYLLSRRVRSQPSSKL